MEKESYLFVCTENTCRSPMAEYMLKEMSQERNLGIVCASRGISVPGYVQSAAKESCEVVLEIYPQSKIKQHIPKQLLLPDFSAYEKILTMTQVQRDIIKKEAGKKITGLANRVFTLKEYAGFADNGPKSLDIVDPFGAGWWTKKFLQEKGLLGKLSSKAHEVQVKGEIWVIDPVMGMDFYRDCRDQIRECLEKIL